MSAPSHPPMIGDLVVVARPDGAIRIWDGKNIQRYVEVPAAARTAVARAIIGVPDATMIERAARAARAQLVGEGLGAWDALSEDSREGYRELARAALAAAFGEG